MPKLRIAIDMDGVVYDFVNSVRVTLLEVLGDDLVGPGTGIRETPSPSDFDWTAWKIDYEVWDRAVADNARRVFASGGFLPRAVEGLNLLSGIECCEFFLCTRPWGQKDSHAWKESKRGKEDWLASTPFADVEVKYVEKKDPKALKYDILVDDNGEHIDEAIDGGASALRVIYPSTTSKRSRSFVPAFTDLYQAARAIQDGVLLS